MVMLTKKPGELMFDHFKSEEIVDPKISSAQSFFFFLKYNLNTKLRS